MEKGFPVIGEDEIIKFQDLGLGRGVDATNTSPWKNKKSFQVRQVCFDDIMGTEEGGSIQNYKSEISSSLELQVTLKASVSVPHTPVTIGLEGEISRSETSSRKVMGKKIVNRSVSFKMHSTTIPDTIGLDNQADAAKKKSSVQPTFEEILSEWILKRIKNRGVLTIAEDSEKKQSIAVLNNYISTASKENLAMIFDDCEDFVRFFGITHYVSSITLGASEHIIMTETDYSTLVNEKASVNVAPFASAEQQLTLRSKYLEGKKFSKYIGKIIDDQVKRGSYDECVIQIDIQPIQFLVENTRFVHLAMHKVLTEYIQESIEDSTGPYLIECGDEQMYWKIDSTDHYHRVSITKDITEASAFHMIFCDDTDEPFDFSIGWQGETREDCNREDEELHTGKIKHKNIMRYLEVKTSFFGKNPGPLPMKSELDNKDSRLVLYNQLGNGYFEVPADITPWINSKGVFFISNAQQKGFLCISRRRDNYICRCVSSRKEHDEENNWMLFRLISAKRHIPSTVAESKRQKPDHIERSKSKFITELGTIFGN